MTKTTHKMDPPTAANGRWQFIDFAKGIAAILMILGHAQIFFDPLCYFPFAPSGSYPMVQQPLQFALYVIQSSVDAFYFCAGIALGRKSGMNPVTSSPKILWKLAKRGLFLIAIDLTWISWCYTGKGDLYKPIFGSIACFGVSFVLMVILQRAKPVWLALLAILILIAREMILLPYPFDAPIYELIYGVFWAPVNEDSWSSLFIISSWLPIILLGYCYGFYLVNHPKLQERKILFRLFVGLAFAFFSMRTFSLFGSFGQPKPNSITQFFLLSKYPASIHFHLLNMSFCFAYLWIGKKWEETHGFLQLKEWVAVCGRQIFFVYIFHLSFFGAATHVFGFTPTNGSFPQSLIWFVLTTILSTKIAKMYEELKLRFGNHFFILRYI